MLLKEGDFSQPSEPKFIKGAILRNIESYGTVGRGTVLSLTFEADQKRYTIPMIQAAGFEFRTEKSRSRRHQRSVENGSLWA